MKSKIRMKIIKGYTPIQNRILLETEISPQARLLLCVLIMHCGLKDICNPSQIKLSKELGCCDRQVRKYLSELMETKLISKKRTGFNKPNTYKVPEEFLVKRDRNSGSGQLGSAIPHHKGNPFPTKSTYIKVKDKSNSEGLKSVRKILEERGLKKPSLLSID